VRPWLAAERTLASLNALADARGVRTASGQPVRFVEPAQISGYYEVSVHETGRVATRPDSLHDWLNALAWLAFPRAKARINALHARTIPAEGGRRGRLRDLLTLFDEGGALVLTDDAELIELLRRCEWKALFWERRERVAHAMRVLVFGHAVLEQAFAPRPGITCKALVVHPGADPDERIAAWLDALPGNASPKDLGPLPVFGYPGWMDGQSAGFYEDARYFRGPRA
jgi:hypothetical protein